MEQNFIENELIIITKATIDKFLQEENPAELIALYTFFYYTAKWQETNIVKATQNYVKKGLGWGIDRLSKSENKLIELGLIEKIQRKNKLGKITGWYVKVNYVFKKNTVDLIHNTQNPQVDEATTGKQETNALSTNSLNALSTNKEILDKSVVEECLEQPTSIVLTLDPELRGSTPAQRLLTIYNDCYKYVYGVPYKPNYQKDLSVLKRLTQRFTECQLARMLVIHFNWYGMSGNNERDNIFLKEALFSIGLFSSNLNKYEVYIRNVLGENFDDDYTMLTETGKYILSIKQ